MGSQKTFVKRPTTKVHRHGRYSRNNIPSETKANFLAMISPPFHRSTSPCTSLSCFPRCSRWWVLDCLATGRS